MNGRFTKKWGKVIELARQEAGRLGHDYVGTEHLLLGLVRLGEGVAVEVLKGFGIDLESIKLAVEKIVPKGPATLKMGEIPFTPRAKKVLEKITVEEARKLGHGYLGTEHILLALISEGEGAAAQVLLNLNIDLEKARKAILELLQPEVLPEAPEIPGMAPGEEIPKGFPPIFGMAGMKKEAQAVSKTPALDAFGRDMTQLARDGKLDPVIGREDEIERVIQILARRTKNNAALIGEPGVGKTAIAEGVAQRIVSGKVPDLLANKRMIALDLAGMVAGTKYRGEFEARLKKAVEEIRRSGNVLIFIDELHTLAGAGAAEGAIDASSILKPSLARGELQCIGATTLGEYRKYIEKDGALERRFQQVVVNEPSVEETEKILEGLKGRYEEHHKVKITPEALKAAAELSERYISDRNLPDKAIDLIDEASARARLAEATMPPHLKDIEKEIEEAEKEKAEAVESQEFEKAVEYRDRVKELKERLKKTREEWEKSKKALKPEVSSDDIAYIVFKWTGIPVIKLTQNEQERLTRMEDELAKRIVGQKEALKTVSDAVRRARVGIKEPKRPIGSFIFAGPTGVGKTELARTLAESLFGDENAMVRFDMSEFAERFTVSRLVGAPPGYVGYEEAGQLTEPVRRRPYTVILLDEIEKAHPDVFNILLQVMDEGRLTDSLGRTANFKNTVVIMTSNVGTEDIMRRAPGFEAAREISHEEMRRNVLSKMKKTFRPEFLNRLDVIIVFHPLDKDNLTKISELLLERLRKRLDKKGIKLELSQKAREFLVTKEYDAIKGTKDYTYAFGARPLERNIERFIEDPLSSELLKGRFKEGSTILVDLEKNRLVFKEKGKPRSIAPSAKSGRSGQGKV
ncbi:ATP-dependent Clp protease ATP-binding subunit [bacterium]|nr:ATP-dependent Clp protease ATP-binding subunit [bacterium]